MEALRLSPPSSSYIDPNFHQSNYTNHHLGILNAELYDDKNGSVMAHEAHVSRMRNGNESSEIPFGMVDAPLLDENERNADGNGKAKGRRASDESEGNSRRRKRVRAEMQMQGEDDEDEERKKSRGRPRVDTKDETAADVSLTFI